MKFACKRYFSSISTENDSSSFFTTSALKCTFFHFSVKDLVNFSKNSNDTGPT